MSQFIGAGDPTLGFIAPNDNRLYDPSYRVRDLLVRRYAGSRDTYATPVPPMIGDLDVSISMLGGVNLWARYYPTSGAGSRVGFVGVTRDQYGTPVGGVTVQLFRTSDDLFIMETVSDVNGNFLLQSWYTPDTHYIVAYKAGVPDIFGTTVNTLVGA